jgi:hypothetical protein
MAYDKITSKCDNFPCRNYRDMFKKKTGSAPSNEEEIFLVNFTNKNTLSPSKEIYYYALFYFKRLFPLFIIRILIRKKMNLALGAEKAPSSIQQLHKELAEIIILTAMSVYAKGGKHDG